MSTGRRQPRGRDAIGSTARALGFVAGAGTAFAGAVGALAVSVASRVVLPVIRERDPVRVIGVHPDAEGDRGTIVLARTIESEAAGIYTLEYSQGAGRARCGAVVDATVGTVTRRYSDAEGPALETAGAVRMRSAPQLDVTDLGLPYALVRVPGELGEFPAWYVPANRAEDRGPAADRQEHRPSRDWVVHVHGRGAAMTEPLRSVPLVAARGWDSLVVSYRNDPGAPAAPDGRYGLGTTEWRDVDAALEWAVSRGAERIVLFGWSMGGSIALQTYFASPAAERIVGLALESPAVSWRSTLRYQGRQLGLPSVVISAGMRILATPGLCRVSGLDEPLPLRDLEVEDRVDELHVPVLLLHSRGDTVVPFAASAAFARRARDRVRLVEFRRARHTRLWNVDPVRWEQAVGSWFDALGGERGTEGTAGEGTGAASAGRVAPR